VTLERHVVCDAVFQHISAHPQNRIEELLPDNWLAARTTAPA
jgi:hypothetical protein